MATGKNPLFDTATTLGKIILFLGVSAICGVLVAGLLVPAAALSGNTASGSIKFFETLPAELQVDPPSQATTVLAADGSVIASLFSENRTRVSLDKMSPYIKNAVISIEDSRFYEHGGVDTTGILRALVSTARGNKQGASTITQQYVNNVINSSLESEGKGDQVLLNGVNKGVGDKLREMKLAIALEKKFTKEQILEGYLNIVFFNRDAYGIEAASRFFFSTTAQNLTLPQAALLAGLVNSPSFYDPITHPDNAKVRRDLVLKAMLTQNKIKQPEYEAAVATPVTTQVTQAKQGCQYAATAPYFCDYVLHLLLNNPAYGADTDARTRKIFRGGLTIKTTLDPNAQAVAQAQVDASAGANPDKWGAALVSVQPGTGKIINMAQNTVWFPAAGKFDTNLNFNVDKLDAKGNDLNGLGGAQPGSTMKPFTFAEWLNEGKSMNQVLNGAVRKYPLDFKWRNSCGVTTGAYNTAEESLGAAPDLQNAEETWYRPLTVLEGLYNSINTITFASAAQLDFCGIQKIVDAVGLHSGLPQVDKDGKILDSNPKINMFTTANLLGSTQTSPLAMASAFATFANDGKYCEPIAITSVTDQNGAQLPAQATNCRDAIKPEVARGVNYALQEVLNRGSGALIKPRISTRTNFPIAAKTGTSNNNESTWVVGHTRGLATASWFGDPLGDQRRPGQNITINGQFYKGIDGYMIAGPQFSNFMAQMAPAYGTDPFPTPPSNMVTGPVTAPAPAPAPPQAPAPSPEPTSTETKKKYPAVAMAPHNTLAGRARSIGRGFAVTAAAGAVAGAAATGYGLWEKNQFVLGEESLPILPPGYGPLRVLHLSDIHFVPGQRRKAAWLASLAGLEPDLVVNTGDNLSHPKAVGPVLEALRPLMEFPGVFVPGSNDYYAPGFKNPASYLLGPSSRPKKPKELDWPRLRAGFGMAGWVDLTNRCQSLVLKGLRVDFSGVDDPHLRLERYAGWPRGTKGQDAKPHLRVAVVHAPYQRVLDHFTGDAADLLLAGHTHGGQICVPGYGALVSNCDLPTWRAKGLHDWESNGRTTPVNVSGGIGTSRFAPVRIACKPEAVLLTLTARS